MIALTEISLLSPYLLSENIWINHFFHLLLALVLFFCRRYDSIVAEPVFIYFLIRQSRREELTTNRWIVFHLNQSLSNIMSNSEQRKKLWQQIGLQKPSSDQNTDRDNKINKDTGNIVLFGQSVKEIGAGWISSNKSGSEISRSGKRGIEQEQQHADRFQRMMEALELEVQQVEQTQAIQIVPHESYVQQIVDYAIELEEEPYEFYNQEISKLPQSVTPLVYSKNSKAIEQTTFRKHKARISLLKMTVCEARQRLAQIREALILFFKEAKNAQEKMREEISLKHLELQRQYQLRLQQSLFHQRQEYEQLKYDYEILRGREEITRTPIKSQLIFHEIEGSEVKTKGVEKSQQLAQVLRQNIELKQKIAVLQTEKDKMLKQASEFKRKMAGIESTTAAVKDSNDKLYEYIFDLEQQIAFHKEQIPKITNTIKKELNENYSKQIEELQEQKQNVLTMLQELQLRGNKVTQERNQIGSKLQATQNELTELKIALQNKTEEIDRLEKLCLSKSQQIQSIIQQNEERQNQYNQIKKIIEEKDQTILQQAESLKKIKLQTPNNSRAYQTASYSRQKPIQSTIKDLVDSKDKQDRKALENLQIQKLVLQKQNLHLKATVQFYNKNYGPYMQGYQQILSPRVPTSSSIENHYQSTQDRLPEQFIADSNIQLKQRQLLKYQNYLQSQARKLQLKQREIESDYAIKHSIQQRHRQSALSAQRSYKQLINQDDYGMKNVAAVNLRSYNGATGVQRTQFCSSEAQAIIQKVKKRQKNHDICCHSRCENSGSCRCDAMSRGSRGSRESDSKQYFRTQQYRPQNMSPSIRMEEYFRTEDRNSKMKLIEDKVKRLKSELKTSLSSMKSQ